MATFIYLLRHGETQWNRDSRIQGQLDIRLSERGIQQAELLSTRLAAVSLKAVYSSDLSRAHATATIVARPHAIEVRPAPEFREINFGAWQGLGWEEVDALYPGSRERLRGDPENARPPGGESWPEVANRVMVGLERLALECADGRVAVVTHGGTGRMAVCSVLGVDVKLRWKIRMDNTAITILARDDGEWRVECLNDTCHLAGALHSDLDD